MTKRTRRSAVTSSSGFPSTAIRSAVNPGRHGAERIFQAERARRARGGRDDGVHRVLAALVDADDELFGVAPVRAGRGVRAEHDLHVPVAEGLAEPAHADAAGPAHLREALRRVVPDADEALAVLRVVVPEQPQVEAEERAVVGEQRERLVVVAVAVLDRGAAGPDDRADDLGAVGVHGDPQSLRPALVAGRLDLLVAQRAHTSLADAARSEDLDNVGPVSLELPDGGADGVRVAGGARHRAQRGQHARPGHVAAVDRVAQVGVERVAEALHRREAGHQGAVGVADRVQHRLGGGLRASRLVQPAVRLEVRGQMHVRVDQPGHDRQVGEVVVHGPAQAVDAGDRRAVHEDARVRPGVAGPVEQQPGPDGDRRLVLGEAEARRGEREHDGEQSRTRCAAWRHDGVLSG